MVSVVRECLSSSSAPSAAFEILRFAKGGISYLYVAPGLTVNPQGAIIIFAGKGLRTKEVGGYKDKFSNTSIVLVTSKDKEKQAD